MHVVLFLTQMYYCLYNFLRWNLLFTERYGPVPDLAEAAAHIARPPVSRWFSTHVFDSSSRSGHNRRKKYHRRRRRPTATARNLLIEIQAVTLAFCPAFPRTIKSQLESWSYKMASTSARIRGFISFAFELVSAIRRYLWKKFSACKCCWSRNLSWSFPRDPACNL